MSDRVACNSAFAVLTAVTGLFVDPSTVTCNAEKVAPGAKDIFSLKVRINLLPSLEISEVVNVGFSPPTAEKSSAEGVEDHPLVNIFEAPSNISVRRASDLIFQELRS